MRILLKVRWRNDHAKSSKTIFRKQDSTPDGFTEQQLAYDVPPSGYSAATGLGGDRLSF